MPTITPWYGLLMLLGLIVSAIMWSRLFRGPGQRRPELAAVYVIGLLGALIGAKAGYLVAEGPLIWGGEHFWLQAAVGKTILGALWGGYLGVEVGKKLVGVREATGDRFALVVPLGLAIGRIGCLLHGCCLGVACEPGWWALHDAQGGAHLPSPVIELAFNLLAFGVIAWLYRRRLFQGHFRGQLFHGYLIAYSLFRIAHEPFRDTPRIALPGGWFITPYQLLAGGLLAFAVWRLVVRHRQLTPAAGAATVPI